MDYQPQGPLYQRHSGTVYSSIESRNPWRPGYLRRLPITGLLAILGAIIGIGACAGILIYSDGKPISHWKFQPTVYLAIAATLTNIFLAFALSEGADIAWWRKASQDKTTVADLHRIWAHGKGFKDAVTSGRNMSLVAVACVFATIAQINSPLLQRASTVQLAHVNTTTQVSFRASDSIPTGYTGYTSGRGYVPSLFRTSYVPIVMGWNSNTSISANGTGCEGLCYTRVRALGLVANCTRTQVAFDLNPAMTSSGTIDVSDPSVQGIQVFSSIFSVDVRRGGFINFTVSYKETSDCKGDIKSETCALMTGVMEYPVIIDGNKSTISLDPLSTIYDDRIVQIQPVPGEEWTGPSTLGGIYMALANKYNSNATMRFTGAVGPYTLLTSGNTALQYTVTNDLTNPQGNCSTSFTNPLFDILAGARELLFRTSIAAATFETPEQKVTAIDSSLHAIYRSNYYYLGGAIAITVIATLAVLSIFRGYSTLGRNPTMSPIEVAKAFNAPLLTSHDGNAEAEELIREVGQRNVRYGAVQEAFASGPPSMYGQPGGNMEYKPYNPHIQEVNARRRLAMGEASVVSKPESGETFAG